MGSPIEPAREKYEGRFLGGPEEHAEALIGKLGSETALMLVDLYARVWPASLYWARVLAAVKSRPRTPDSWHDGPESEKTSTGAGRFLGSSWPRSDAVDRKPSGRSNPARGR
jgi:hypothetical protein